MFSETLGWPMGELGLAWEVVGGIFGICSTFLFYGPKAPEAPGTPGPRPLGPLGPIFNSFLDPYLMVVY